MLRPHRSHSSPLTLLLILSAVSARAPDVVRRPAIGSPESVLAPCYVPAGVDTTGWQTIQWFGEDARKPFVMRVPGGFHRDPNVRFEHGGELWLDGKRKLEQHNSYGSYTCIRDDRNPGCGECTDTIAGVPLRIDTTYDSQDSLYRVAAVSPADGGGPLGTYSNTIAESPDSADQRLFLVMIRTIEPVSALTRTGALYGRVVHQNGTAAPNASVLIAGTQRGTTANAGGDYTIPDVPIGGYLLEAHTAGFVPARAGIWVDPGRTTKVDLKLGATAAPLASPTLANARSDGTEGRSQTGSISGRVTDERGAGVPYVNILLKGTMLGARADSAGTFRMVKVPIGTYTLVIRMMGFAASERAGVTVRADQTATVDFKLKEAPVRIVAGPEITGPWKSTLMDTLFGAWRWVRSAGGWGGDSSPSLSGWSRFLYFHVDGTYSFWEEDSVRKYWICGGKFALHPPERTARMQAWIELPGWWEGWAGGRQWVHFFGADTLTLYPGGGNQIVTDMGTRTYVREKTRSAPKQVASTPRSNWRPARLHKGTPITYYAELPPALTVARDSLGKFYEWGDWAYAWLLPASYRYTDYQIPSAVLGDFDGDSLTDVAIHGWDGKSQSKVAILLSNLGSPRGIIASAEPVAFEPEHHRPRAPLYLELFPAGKVFADSLGAPVALRTDAIRVSQANGEAGIFYYRDGKFLSAKPLDAPRPAGNR